MKLLGSTKIKITVDENGDNVHCLEIDEVELFHCHIINNNYLQGLRFCIHLFLINRLVKY